MYITGFYLKDFRNISSLRVSDISPGINMLVGENAQGKTNIIEGINFLSCARSFRNVPDEALIAEGRESCELSCALKASYSSVKVEGVLYRDKKRSFRINGLPVKRLSDMIGRLNTVVFAPEDIRAIKERPQQRRRLIDIEISKIKPSYCIELQRYMSIIKNKSRLLKENADSQVISAFNAQLAASAAALIKERRWFFSFIAPAAANMHSQMSGQKEALELKYLSCSAAEDPEAELLERLAAVLEKERRFGMCLLGPHREDMDILVDGRSARFSASQGQQRTAMISFKLACALLAESYTLEKPVLLLDDVLSELDTGRRRLLLKKTADFQVFITATDAFLQTGGSFKSWRVRSGEISNI